MADFIKQQKRQKSLIIILFLTLLIAIFMLWPRLFKKVQLVIKEGAPSILEFDKKKAEIDFSILENPILKEFQDFELIEPFNEEKGRENPFLPY